MYETYYGLQKDPFRLRPDARFAFRHESYARARNHLEYGLFRGEGLLLLTGAPGSGKTTLVEDLLVHHDDPALQVARMVGLQTDVDGFLRMLAFALGVIPGGDQTANLIAIQRFLRECAERDQRVLLIVDNAQDLARESVEELRVLGDDEWSLQVLLLGQRDLGELIAGEHLEDLRQRIIACCDLQALSAAGTPEYIRHRLEVAGWTGVPEISGDACALIHHYSGGNPRRINMLCARLLLSGFADDRHRFDAADVRSLVGQLAPGLLEAVEIGEEETDEQVLSPSPESCSVVPLEHGRRAPVLHAVDSIDLDDDAPRWLAPTLPMIYSIDCEPAASRPETREPRRHVRHRPPTGSRRLWLLLALLVSMSLGWVALDRSGSGRDRLVGATLDLVEAHTER